MAKVHVWVVHDELGRIISVARPSKDAKTIVLSGAGQAVFKTEVDENTIAELVSGKHRVNVEQNSIVAHSPRSQSGPSR